MGDINVKELSSRLGRSVAPSLNYAAKYVMDRYPITVTRGLSKEEIIALFAYDQCKDKAPAKPTPKPETDNPMPRKTVNYDDLAESLSYKYLIGDEELTTTQAFYLTACMHQRRSVACERLSSEEIALARQHIKKSRLLDFKSYKDLKLDQYISAPEAGFAILKGLCKAFNVNFTEELNSEYVDMMLTEYIKYMINNQNLSRLKPCFELFENYLLYTDLKTLSARIYRTYRNASCTLPTLINTLPNVYKRDSAQDPTLEGFIVKLHPRILDPTLQRVVGIMKYVMSKCKGANLILNKTDPTREKFMYLLYIWGELFSSKSSWDDGVIL